MKIQIALLTLSLAALSSSCGDDGSGTDGGSSYQLTTGTYAVTNASATGTDQCGLIGAYTAADKKIGITSASGAIVFNLSNDSAAAPDTLPHAVLTGNTIGQTTEANYTIAYGSTCVVRVHRTVTGTMVANNSALLTLSFSAAQDTGTCVAADTSFSALPCSSTYVFTATKQ